MKQVTKDNNHDGIYFALSKLNLFNFDYMVSTTSTKKLIKIKNSDNTFFEHKEVNSDDELVKKITKIMFDDYIDFNYRFYEIFVVYYVNPFLNENDKCNCRLKIKKVGDKVGK